MIKKIITVISLILGLVALFLLLMIFLLNSGRADVFVAKAVSNQASKYFNGDLAIASISGRFFSDIRLQNILVSDASDTVLHCEEIKINYVFKNLFRRKLDIRQFHIKNLHLKFTQLADSSWNLEKLLTVSGAENPSTTDFNWQIAVADFMLEQLTAEIHGIADNQFIPEYLQATVRLNGNYSNNAQTIHLEAATLATLQPDFTILELSGKLSRSPKMLRWDSVTLKSVKSNLNTFGTIALDTTDTVNAKIQFIPLNFADITTFFPDMTLTGNPELSLSITGNSEKYSATLSGETGQQKLLLTGWLAGYDKNPRYSAQLSLANLDGAYWTSDQNFKSRIAGTVKIKGKNFDIEESEFDLNGRFSDIQFQNYSFSDLVLRSSKRNDQLSGALNSKTWLGQINFNYHLNTIFSTPAYKINSQYKNINLAQVEGLDSLVTNLNGDITISGTGTSMADLNAQISLNSTNSTLLAYLINDFEVTGNFNKGNYDFAGLHVDTPYFMVNAHGRGNLHKSNDIHFAFEPRALNALVPEATLPDFQIHGKIGGHITGSIDSLVGNATLALHDLKYDSLALKTVQANVDITVFDRQLFNGSVSLDCHGINYLNFPAQSINLAGGLGNDFFFADITANLNDSLKILLSGRLNGFKNPLIRVNQLVINSGNTEWITNHDAIFFQINPDNIFVNRFSLNAGFQNISVHGSFSFTGEENLTLKVEQLKLQELPLNDYVPYPLSGDFSAFLAINGTAANPIIENEVFVENLRMNTYKIDSIRTAGFYQHDHYSGTAVVNSHLHPPIALSLNLPLRLSLQDSSFLLDNSPQFSATAKIDNMDLKNVFAIYPLPEFSISGLTSANLNITNTLNNPVFNGSAEITNATFKNDIFGANYRNIHLLSTIDNNTLLISKFNASSNKKGQLSLHGFINLKNVGASRTPNFDLHLKAIDFEALKSNQIQLHLDSNIDLSGSFQHPLVKGDIRVSRSKINPDYFVSDFSQKADDPVPPLLVQAVQYDSVSKELPGYSEKSGARFSGTSFYKNITGEVLLSIPGNTWFAGKDMNFELEGTIRIIKSTENPAFFGKLKVRRGSYKIYGKNFNFNKGELTFTGGKEINPYVDFLIFYRFRDYEKQIRTLKLAVTGRLLQPKMEFKLEDTLLEEKDAIAYIVFGKNIDQLSEHQKQNLSSSENIATTMAFSQLSSLLRDRLQQSTGLDVVELMEKGSSRSNRVTLGKYITNKLYISYEKNYMFDKKNKIMDAEKFMLEYQFRPSFSLKATNQTSNSGFDFVLKKTWK